MVSNFTDVTAQEVQPLAGENGDLDAVLQGSQSTSCVAEYRGDIFGWCDVDDCELSPIFKLRFASPSYADIPIDRWGFTVWRTVFTPGSDAAFVRALDIIGQWVKHECFSEVKNTYTSTGAEIQDYKAAQQVWKLYHNIIMEDHSLEGAFPETVRQKFLAWIESRGVEQIQLSRYRYCLLIGEDVLETLGRFPTPPIEGVEEKWQRYSLKVIDVEIDGKKDDEFPHAYRSCIMTPPWLLAQINFFSHNVDADEMRDKYRGMPTYAFAEFA